MDIRRKTNLASAEFKLKCVEHQEYEHGWIEVINGHVFRERGEGSVNRLVRNEPKAFLSLSCWVIAHGGFSHLIKLANPKLETI